MVRSPHILVVDGVRNARRQVCDCLQGGGFRVTAVPSGRVAKRVLEKRRVDLIVLDVQLPGEDGLTLCRDLCSHSRAPVMIVSTLADEIDRIIGLEIGADDYLPKPFNPRELLSRAKAILRRTLRDLPEHPSPTAGVLQFADWTLCPIRREVMHADGTRAALTGSEYRLLTQLLIEAPRPLSRARLIERWCDREFDPADRRIDVRISRLRHLLRDNARSPAIIKTLHGRGYAIGVSVSRHRLGDAWSTTLRAGSAVSRSEHRTPGAATNSAGSVSVTHPLSSGSHASTIVL